MNKLFYHTFTNFKSRKVLFALFITVLILNSCADIATNGSSQAEQNPSSAQIAINNAPTSVPTPVATSISSRLDQPFEQDLLEGDYEKVFDQNPFSSEAVRSNPNALFVLGKAYYLQNNYTFALETLTSLTTHFPENPVSLNAWYLVGEIYITLERYNEAANAYSQILGSDHAIDALILPKLADAFSYDGQYLNAVQHYQQALLIDPENSSYKIKIGRAQMFNGDLTDALSTFQTVKESTNDDYVKAQVNLLLGQVYVLMEDLPSAFVPWQENVTKYPLSADTFNALVGLINYDQPVNQLNRGLVDHFAGKHDIALIAFDEYLSGTTDPDPTVYFYMGLSQRELGDYDLAIESFDQLISDFPENQYWISAWDEKAYTYWAYLDDHPSAWKTLETYAINYPQNATASNYLFEAGRIHERGKDLNGAAALWEGLPVQFPDSTQRYDAMFQAGIVRFRSEQFDQALSDFNAAGSFALDKTEQAKAKFWEAKTSEKLGKSALATQTFQLVIDLTPFDYYGLRARDIISQEAPFAVFSSEFGEVNIASLKPAADEWLRILLGVPAEFDLTNLGTIQDGDAFKRGLFLWNCGEYQQARKQFTTAGANYSEDAIAQYKLAGYMYSIGNYADARNFMARALSLIGYADPAFRANLPEYFNKVIYAVHFHNQISAAAQKYSLDPYFITAMAWQESAFDPTALSSSGALGLLQIMPATGQDVAARSGLYSPFSLEMLYDPGVNLNLGAFYLNSNLNYLEKDPFAALAGYNAGPGNAKIWKDLANGDLDLELEIIRYGETRQYIKGIYTAYELYELFYK